MSRLAAHEMQGALQHGARVPERPGGPGVGDGNVEHLGRRRRRRVIRHFPHLRTRERIKRRRAGGRADQGVEGEPRRGPGEEERRGVLRRIGAARAWRGRQVSRLPRRARAWRPHGRRAARAFLLLRPPLPPLASSVSPLLLCLSPLSI
jgi:hypothetical protein